MSDRTFTEQAARRRRLILLAVFPVLLAICGFLAVRNTFYDRCTLSFNRSEQAVIESYLAALSAGQLEGAQNCWQRDAYYDLSTGCSEICLQRVSGVALLFEGVEFTPAGEGLQAAVKVRCLTGGDSQTAAVTLAAQGGSAPWRHWRIIRSDLGGSASQPWCR